ncbi:MAG: type VI secretion system-associated FHA domain protein TagH [Gammaproteobacteria bacterium]|nr:type VI secretion system-associated FHA domain protein TagH [Gammaproteobacteria bacterium]MDH5802697.1 type VI secretion system-associated FHA domain protein TagH [Gammaproteobacteria bacterium]
MSITFSITNQPAAIPGQSISKTFEQGGTIGRTRTCDWVLVDASRFISGKHATISQQNGHYQITDTSTNGVYINDAKLPLGKGNSAPLQHGDTLKIGEYIISISINEAMVAEPVDHMGSGNAFVSNPPAMQNFVGNSHASPVDPLDLFNNPPPSINSDTPFQLVDDYLPEAAPKPVPRQTQSDNSSPLANHFTPPNIIPDDWLSDKSQAAVAEPIISEDNLRFSSPASLRSGAATRSGFTSSGQIPELKPAGKPTGKPVLKKRPAPPPAQKPVSGEYAAPAALQAVLNGMNVNGLNIPPEKANSFLHTVGEVVKECVNGAFNVLRARTNIKSEFRMSMTTIQAAENNPLKFSVNVDEAIRNMFGNTTGSYLPPVKALKEGFEDIEGHQLAVMAGTQAAILALLKRFDPRYLELHFDNAHGRGILPGTKKAKYWDSYEDYFREVASSVEDNFQNMFGEEFARAYEAQIQRLLMSRRNSR